MGSLVLGGIALGVFVVLYIVIAMIFRTVVSTNDVHIVQSAKKTISYGKGEAAGNTYYNWPASVPVIGIKVIQLPVSVFDVKLSGYAAYDKGRVPFVVDIMAFFRVTDSGVAAQRVHSFPELHTQLESILQGAIRTILASSEIEEILEGRSKFGEMFTKEVDHQLLEWGVQNVKTIELMDIRDAEGSKVIANIMEKKKSLIEMQSRVAVAENQKTAKVAEINAKREADVSAQEAEQLVGERTALKEQAVGIAKEKAQQTIKEQAAITAEKAMAVLNVEHVRKAEIEKKVNEVEAEQEKVTTVIRAEGAAKTAIVAAEASKETQILNATGALEATKRHAEGVKLEGDAKAGAEQALQMATVTPQITLAKEIGENKSYQTYLIEIRKVEMGEIVGVEQAKALQKANVKVIANTGTPVDGVTDVMSLMTSKGGTQLGAMVEAFAQTEMGAELIAKVVGKKPEAAI